MTIEDITTIIQSGNLDLLKTSFETNKFTYLVSGLFNKIPGNDSGGGNYQLTDYKQYEPMGHDVMDLVKRPDKIIKSDEGNERNGATVKVSRIPVPEQKKIVLLASAFLGVPCLSSTPKPGIETDMLTTLSYIWEDNKLDYKFKEISKRTMSERESAELWFTEPTEPDYWDNTPLAGIKFKLRMRILSPVLGDTLYPVFDSYSDMVAFGRYYEIVEQDAVNIGSTQKTAHFDIYTKDRFYFASRSQAGWIFNYDPLVITSDDGTETKVIGIKNLLGKIPVIYYNQPNTEWADVEQMIERLEKKFSNHADTNDYFDSPIVKAKGQVTGFSDKGESGKVLQMSTDADVSYLTWDSLPASNQLEFENLIKSINSYTHTPNISFDNVKGLGTFTGIALKMFFMDAHLKASDKEEIYGEAVQRRINYLKSAIAYFKDSFKAALRLSIKPEFEYFLPKNETEDLTNIIAAVNAGILSVESAIKQNPLVEDAVNEIALIKKEADAKVVPAADPNTGDPKLKVA